MGFFNIFKRKPTDLRPTRSMEMKLLYECPQCSKEKAMRFKVSLAEDYKHIYIQWVGQSSSPTLVKLPLVDMKVDKQKNYIVEKLYDRLLP